MKRIMVLWLLKVLGQIAMVAERRGSSPWHWVFYSLSSFCYMRLRFESTRPNRHGFTITPRFGPSAPKLGWFYGADDEGRQSIAAAVISPRAVQGAVRF
jgi:hypothetical protein